MCYHYISKHEIRGKKMNKLINANPETMTVSARDLHEALEITKRFSAWFESNSSGFVEGEDFTSVPTSTVVNNGAVRELEDYQCSVDMAKHICLMSRTEKGKQCRQYLIDLEKAWNTPEQVMARALKIANQTIDSLKSTTAKQAERIEEMRPKEIFADAVSASHTSILIGDLAKLICQNGYQIGQKRLFQWLRAKGYLVKSGASYNMPTQRYVEQGLFEVKESNIQNLDGSIRITRTTKVTGKGQVYFVNKFMGAEP
jgi:anti-repressor protein